MSAKQNSDANAKVVEESDTPAKPEDYVSVDNLRLVKPYYFDFRCYVKQRWAGHNIIELFSKEFPSMPREYYQRAFRAGKLRVEGHPQVTETTPLKTSMCVRHLIHRHEPPALGGQVQVVSITPDYVAVVKPAGLPVHTAGQYRKNTVMGVMEAERPELLPLLPTHRLDKPVSGLLLLARSSQAASRLRQHLEGRTCEKVYVARVLGRFPAAPSDTPSLPEGVSWVSPAAIASATATAENSSAGDGPSLVQAEEAVADGPAPEPQLQVDVPLSWDPQRNHASPVPPGRSEPSLASQARPALTRFRLLSVSEDGATSVVECRPLTGRTHQIRVHLQYLGHSIANDTQYGGTFGQALSFYRLPASVLTGHDGRPATAADSDMGEAVAGSSSTCHGADAAGAADGSASRGGASSLSGVKRPRTAFPSPAAQPGEVQEGAAQGPGAVEEDPAACCGHRPASDQVAAHPNTSTSTSAAAAPGATEAVSSQPSVPPAVSTSAEPAPAEPCSDAPRASPSLDGVPPSLQPLYRDPRYHVPPDLVDSVCVHCPCLVPRGYPIELEPLWLHARQYSVEELSFQAPLPEWAAEGFLARPAATSAAAAAAAASTGAAGEDGCR